MEHSEGKLTIPEGMCIYTQEWLPDVPKAVVLLVHGLGEHSGRYAHVAQAFNQAGYAVLSFDMPGHGHSDGVRGHIPSYDLVMKLIRQHLDEAAARFPELPRFLYGHSMGGNMVLYFCKTQKPDFLAGVMVTSPGLGTAAPVPAWKKLLGKMLFNMAPSFQMDNGLDRSGLSRDPAVEQRYSADPLVHGKISARLGMELIDAGEWIVHTAADFPPLPLLLMQGAEDRIVNPQMTKGFAEKTSAKITFKMWPGAYHELHNEPEKEQVIQTMIDWMDKTAAI